MTAIPFQVSGDDLNTWASSVNAHTYLPELVRRLLAATTTTTHLEFPAGMGIFYPGWDGVVGSVDGNAFCPSGISGWELSTDANPRAKADADFRARAKDPNPLDPGETVFVAVTLRRFPSKQKWAAAKKKAGGWRDVRVLDADGVATWLESTPSVAAWLLEILGRPQAGLRTPETFLRQWCGRTSPPLPPEIVLGGRDEAVARVRTWLTGEARALRLRAGTREEAVAFVVAAIRTLPNAERDVWTARTVIVDTDEAWHRITRMTASLPLALLPAFTTFDATLAAGTGHFVAIPIEFAARPGTEEVTLGPIRSDVLAPILRGAGLDPGAAERHARDCGGSLSALQRLLGHAGSPDWVREEDRNRVAAMLLAGAWEPRNEADRRTVATLAGDEDHRGVEGLCARLHRVPDPPLDRMGEPWAWIAPADAWNLLAPLLTDSDVERLRDAVRDVLTEEDPAYETSAGERFRAGFQGRRLSHSSSLRRGLASSLAYLSMHDPEVAATLGGVSATSHVDGIVYELLDPVWIRWASLADVLPVLAEAAPGVFLQRLTDSLNHGLDGVARLLREESMWGHSPHTGLLWALETLAWDPESLRHVVETLARLAEADPGGKLANRPGSSLAAVLRVAFPGSMASVRQRLSLLRAVAARHPRAAWEVALGTVENLHMGVFRPTVRPKYRPWPVPPEPESVTTRDLLEHLSRTTPILLELAGTDPERWAPLIECMGHRGAFESDVLDALEARRDEIKARDSSAKAWAALRRHLHYEYRARDGEDARGATLARVEALHAAFTPDDPVLRFEFLFQMGWADLPERTDENFRVQEERLQQVRREALDEVLARDDGWEQVGRLAAASQWPGLIGMILRDRADADTIEEYFLDPHRPEPLAPVVPGFLSLRSYTKGLPWFEVALRRLLHRKRLEEAAQAVVMVRATNELWDRIDALGEPLRSEYWKHVQPYGWDQPNADWERGIRALVEHGRAATAVEMASHSTQPGKSRVSASTMVTCLEALARSFTDGADALTPDVGRNLGYYVDRLFENLRNDKNAPEERLALLEYQLFPILSHSGEVKPEVLASLGRSPEEFAQLVCWVYKERHEDSETAVEVTDVSEEERDRARYAFNILFHWTGYPGIDVPADRHEEREERVLAWSEKALDLTRNAKRQATGEHAVAAVLARVPKAADGHWPCLAARRLVETGSYPELMTGLVIAHRNLRGVTVRNFAEGGVQERALAASLRSSADAVEEDFPNTALMLRDLARAYERWGEREDVSARADRWRYR